MVDYILDDWGDEGNWTLNGTASWFFGLSCDVNGYGEQEFNTSNANWKFEYWEWTYGSVYGEGTLVCIYLDGDAIPIIFGVEYQQSIDDYKYFIEYNGDRKAELEVDWDNNTPLIRRVDSMYYFSNIGGSDETEISYNYGSSKKATKVRFASRTCEVLFDYPQWYYTVVPDEDYCFIA